LSTAPSTPATRSPATTDNLGFLLAKASARWNELLAEAFAERGFDEVQPAYGSVLLPLFEEDGLRMGDLGRRARLSKQTMTSLVAQMERDGLVRRERDVIDRRARRVVLLPRAHAFRPVAEEVLAGLDARIEEHLTRTTNEAMRRGLRGVIEA
jgi:DNA-binding MarR family transcriptional regulator